ncbi:MAG: hypothetical protein U1C33_07500 [Candidatus Cloacimonadaceae bacterium]|nr:hypothetical protein [Candidatus Cloacimonadaceae bacterium]
MKSNPNGRNWNPTVTLAKLFEEQNQFFDALAAYELIEQTESSPAIREKIESLHLRILSDPNSKYDPRIEQLFSPEELAYLKILNHSAFDNLSLVAERISEGFPDSESYMDTIDEEQFTESLDEVSELQDILREIEEQSRLLNPDVNSSLEDYTLHDFLVAILSRFPKETSLARISLIDLISIFTDMRG